MGKHDTFNTDLTVLNEVWREKGLLSYNFTYWIAANGKYRAICPNNMATVEDYTKHRDDTSYRLFFYFWTRLADYFDAQPIGTQRYLVKKHKMVRKDD